MDPIRRPTRALLAGAALSSALFVAGGITLAAAVPAGSGLPSAFADAGNTEHATCPGPPVCTREEYQSPSDEETQEEESPPPEETQEEEESPPPEETQEEEEPPPPEETQEEEPQPQETTEPQPQEPQPQEPQPTETESGTEPGETPSETESEIEEQETELEDETEEPEGEDEEIPGPPLPDEAPPPPRAAAFYGPVGVGPLQALATALLVLATGALVASVHRRGGL